MHPLVRKSFNEFSFIFVGLLALTVIAVAISDLALRVSRNFSELLTILSSGVVFVSVIF